jgi:hypothetical protein
MAKKKVAEPTLNAQDIELLIRIRNGRFVKSTHLCDAALRLGIAKTKPPLYTRVGKLINSGLVEVAEEHPGKFSVYVITKSGLQFLHDQGNRLASLTVNSDALSMRDQIPHALMLGEIRGRWETELGAQQWMTDLEVAAANLEDETAFQKNYDSVCRLPRTKWQKQPIRVAIEYERTRKYDASRYSDIGQLIRQETAVSFVLYVCELQSMIPPIMDEMKTGCVVFTTAHALLTHGINCPLFFWKGPVVLLSHLAEVLAAMP